MTAFEAALRPPIQMIDIEADLLSDLAMHTEGRNPQVSRLLLEEIARADVRDAALVDADVVTINATVAFLDEASGTRRSVQLVLPGDADIAAGRISILTPVGAGLIGLRAGQSILWPDRDGRERKLTIVKVSREPVPV